MFLRKVYREVRRSPHRQQSPQRWQSPPPAVQQEYHQSTAYDERDAYSNYYVNTPGRYVTHFEGKHDDRPYNDWQYGDDYEPPGQDDHGYLSVKNCLY